jgi:3-deoxy-7-phosphoheptulonate synthase
MIVTMATNASHDDVRAVTEVITGIGGRAHVSRGGGRTLIGLDGDAGGFGSLDLPTMSGVQHVVPTSEPYRLVSRAGHAERSVVHVGGVPIGPGTMTLMAGPCAVETPEQTLSAAQMAKAAGASILRGGAYKPRTSPYSFEGLGKEGLKILADVRAETGLPIVTEVVDAADVELVASYADMLQVGTRNSQNFSLLRAVGQIDKPVLLKRGLSGTIEEWLLSAEHIAHRGNLDIVLCERGIRTYEKTTRNTLDISAVPVAQQLSHLPVIVDPSHSGGQRALVLPLARAAMAIGADGLIIDVHPTPEAALCDGAQALTGVEMAELVKTIDTWLPAIGRNLAQNDSGSA